MLADTSWENEGLARMENLQLCCTNPTSEHAAKQMDLTGIGSLLLISFYKHMNSLATDHFLDEFDERLIQKTPASL